MKNGVLLEVGEEGSDRGEGRIPLGEEEEGGFVSAVSLRVFKEVFNFEPSSKLVEFLQDVRNSWRTSRNEVKVVL